MVLSAPVRIMTKWMVFAAVAVQIAAGEDECTDGCVADEPDYCDTTSGATYESSCHAVCELGSIEGLSVVPCSSLLPAGCSTGDHPSCATLPDFCNDASLGESFQQLCPDKCGLCTTTPVTTTVTTSNPATTPVATTPVATTTGATT